MSKRSKNREPIFRINLESNGGLIDFYSISDFIEWTKNERKRWDWISSVSDPRVPQSIQVHVISQLDGIINFATSLEESTPVIKSDPEGALLGHYGGAQPSLYHSTGSVGQTILVIKEIFSPAEAALAYALLVNVSAVDVRNPLHFKLMGLIANPGTIDAAKHMESVREILSDASTISARIHSEQRQILEDSQSKLQSRDREARRLARNALRKFVWANWESRRKIGVASHESIQRIDQTRLAYQQAMQLRAAVTYWEEKRRKHSLMKAKTFKQLMIFSICSTIFAFTSFSFASIFILEASRIDIFSWINIVPKKGSLAPTFFGTIAVWLGTTLTCLFWAGRVLVRNYLTERRMLADADERRIMTMTFLALVNEGAAGEEDRLVVLNALFRPSFDGTKIDEGSADIALPALLAKLMDQRHAR